MFIIMRHRKKLVLLGKNDMPFFSPDITVSQHEISARAFPVSAGKVVLTVMLLFTCSMLLNTKSWATENLTFSDEEMQIIAMLAGRNLQPVRDETNSISGNTDAIAVGKTLFFNKRLSGDNQYSCASCHNPEKSWTDGKDINNLRGTPLKRNTPSLWNLAWSRWYFWDGRADTLWLQALGPIESHIEQDGSRIKVARLMQEDTDLRLAYERLFGKFPASLDLKKLPMSGKPVPENPEHPDQQAWNTLTPEQQQAVNHVFANTGKLIAAFEETIISNNSQFDHFTVGLQENDEEMQQALSLAAQRGLKLFIGKAKCYLCHSGPNLSDSEFHGVMTASSLDKKSSDDQGRYAVIPELLNNEFNSKGPYSDAPAGKPGKLEYVYRSIELRDKFKTPILRNIAQTAPYMHTGEVAELKTVIKGCNLSAIKLGTKKHVEVSLLAKELNEVERKDLEEFLNALTDEDFLSSFSSIQLHTGTDEDVYD